ncbi:MAG: TspO/MBR family protein [Christensenella sp.]|uniref:TspO/MBR family protein n=1 Tax=Christensenella sp. TaxID=1935934 RepID=UPI002B1FF462|nr:TspO/MBR family protein [Christensenella sp.]MEA5002948.1 TspO/MBR family protein [Christensenella sp.]
MFIMTYQMEERRREKNAKRIKAIFAVLLTAAGAVIASLSTKTDTPWYQSLTLSPLQPPPSVFGIVWTVLYVLLAISFALVATQHKPRGSAVFGYILNIILNALWSPVFFLMQEPLPALFIMLALLVNLVILMRNVWPSCRAAMYLLIPYLAWLCIATVLNVSVVAFN